MPVPLPTLLSQAPVAYMIEFDNEAEPGCGGGDDR